MTLLCGSYQGATRCTSGPQPGPQGGMAWFLGAYGEEKGTNLGIFNCRTVRGGSTTSLHGEGRADDFGTPRTGQSWSWDLAELLRIHSAELGIQCIIHRRKIWSSSYCQQGWRDYTGVADHYDHLHVEWTKVAAARSKADTIALWQRILGDPSPIRPDAHVIVPPSAPAGSTRQATVPATLRPGGNNDRGLVVLLQSVLAEVGLYGGPIDGVYSDNRNTEAGVRALQRTFGLTQDGVVGRQTWCRAVALARGNLKRGAFRGSAAVKVLQLIVGANADGVFGTGTEDALKAVQRGVGLTGSSIDGVYGKGTAARVAP